MRPSAAGSNRLAALARVCSACATTPGCVAGGIRRRVAVITRRCGADRTGGQLRGSGRQHRGQHLSGQRVAWRQELSLLHPSLGLTGGQVQHPGHPASGATESGDQPCLLRLQLGNHVKHPRVGSPEVGLGVAQHLEQPMNVGLSAILLHRDHETILAGTPGNFGFVALWSNSAHGEQRERGEQPGLAAVASAWARGWWSLKVCLDLR